MGKSNVELVFEAKIDKLTKQLNTAKKQLNTLEKKSKDTNKKVQKNFESSTDSVKKLGAALGVTFGAAIILRGLKKTLDTLKEFETEMAQLRSITGMAAQDMVFMKEKAIELSEASTRSAKEVVAAFKLVGSAQPELLKSASALAEVTKQAIILSEAGGITVPEAAIALTSALNMFGKSAKDAAKFTDILATSQQKGSAFIQSLSESMINAGSIANALGMSFETTNAVLQGFAKGGLQGTRAGTAFAMIMSKLASQAENELNPELTDINKILDTLEKRNLSVGEANKLVGEETGKYLLTLIEQKDIVQELSGALWEEGNALAQAAINTDTMQVSLDNVGKSWDNFILSIKAGEGAVSKAVKGIADNLSETFANMGRIQRAELAGMDKWQKFAAQWGSIINPVIAQYAENLLEASGEAETLDAEMEELNETLDGTTEVLDGTDGAVGLMGGLRDKIKEVNKELLSAQTAEEIGRLNRKLAELKEELKGLAELGIVKDVSISADDLDLSQLDTGDFGELQQGIESFYNWLTDETIEQGDDEIAAWQAKEARKQKIIEESFRTAAGFVYALGDIFEVQKQNELSTVGDNAKKREEIERKYAKKQQLIAVAQTLISGAEGIVKTGANLGYPLAIPFQILQGIQTAIQVAVIKSQKFATGVLDLQGPGTGTSDSINAMLSKGESVMTAKETKEYYPYLKAMKEGKFPRFEMDLMDKLGGWKHTTNNNMNYDNGKEINELQKIRTALEDRPFRQEYYEGKNKIIKRGNVTTKISLN